MSEQNDTWKDIQAVRDKKASLRERMAKRKQAIAAASLTATNVMAKTTQSNSKVKPKAKPVKDAMKPLPKKERVSASAQRLSEKDQVWH